jgi:hypothetical protein
MNDYYYLLAKIYSVLLMKPKDELTSADLHLCNQLANTLTVFAAYLEKSSQVSLDKIVAEMDK